MVAGRGSRHPPRSRAARWWGCWRACPGGGRASTGLGPVGFLLAASAPCSARRTAANARDELLAPRKSSKRSNAAVASSGIRCASELVSGRDPSSNDLVGLRDVSILSESSRFAMRLQRPGIFAVRMPRCRARPGAPRLRKMWSLCQAVAPAVSSYSSESARKQSPGVLMARKSDRTSSNAGGGSSTPARMTASSGSCRRRRLKHLAHLGVSAWSRRPPKTLFTAPQQPRSDDRELGIGAWHVPCRLPRRVAQSQ